MVATGREPTLPPDVHQDAHASLAVDDPSDYVEAITQLLQLTINRCPPHLLPLSPTLTK